MVIQYYSHTLQVVFVLSVWKVKFCIILFVQISSKQLFFKILLHVSSFTIFINNVPVELETWDLKSVQKRY